MEPVLPTVEVHTAEPEEVELTVESQGTIVSGKRINLFASFGPSC